MTDLHAWFIIALCCSNFACAQTAPQSSVHYPDHSKLLILRSTNGEEQSITNAAGWSKRVEHIRAGMELAMGPLPDSSKKVALNVERVSEEATPKYTRIKLRYTPEEGDRVPAWLLVPKTLPTSGRAPAMLCLHQTVPIGKDEPAGLGGKPSLHYAHELAQRGYVCLVPDYPSFGEYAYDFKTQGSHYGGGSMKAIWNNIRAVDLLESLPQVDKNAIGVIGHSLGGHNSLFTAVFEPRLKAVVTSCGYTPFHDYYGGKVAGWTSDRYMPRIRDVYENNADKLPFDFYEVLSAIAPRGIYSCSPTRDANFDIAGVRKAVAEAGKVFELLGAKDRLVLDAPEAEHDFPQAQRDAAYAWLDKLLSETKP